MTDYNPIPDNILEPDDPIPADLGIRWRDNPIAMFEGAPGAPRIAYAALDTWFSTAGDVGSLAFLITTSGAVGIITAGTTYAGSSLTYSGFHKLEGISDTGSGLTGTWRALGSVLNAGVNQRATLFVRIA